MVLDHGHLVRRAGTTAERTCQASAFKARCLALLDDDAASTDGSATLIATDDEDFFSTGETWDAG